jgi:hypothetical protein
VESCQRCVPFEEAHGHILVASLLTQRTRPTLSTIGR